MARRYYAYELPMVPSGRPWVPVIVHFANGRSSRGSYHPSGKFFANGTDVTKRIVYWEYDK